MMCNFNRLKNLLKLFVFFIKKVMALARIEPTIELFFFLADITTRNERRNSIQIDDFTRGADSF